MLTQAIALGFNAKADCNHCAIIGGTGVDAVKVGIGVSNPKATFDVHDTNNTRLKISNDNSDEIYLDFIRNDAAKIDYDWRLLNSTQGAFEVAYHKTDLESNAPTSVVSVNSTHLNPGSNQSIDLGQSNTRWKTIWAKSAHLSQLLSYNLSVHHLHALRQSKEAYTITIQIIN